MMNPEPAGRLILCRHGQSEANAANRFTGSSDPKLTEQGIKQAYELARALEAEAFQPKRVFRSSLRRCAETTGILIEVLGAPQNGNFCSKALNERDYGSLTGLDKNEAEQRFGADLVRTWRRSYNVAPPGGESLRDTAARILAYYVNTLLPAAMDGGDTLIVAHGNSLRALVHALDGLTPTEIETLEISTGGAIIYELARTTKVCRRRELNMSRRPHHER